MRIFIVLLVVFPLKIIAQNNFYDSVFSSTSHIYHFSFSSANNEIEAITKQHSENYISHLLSANYYWWLIITGHDTTETRKNYYNHLDKSLNLLLTEKKENYSNDTLYALITTYAYKARIHAMNNQYFSALSQLNNCIDFVKQSFGKDYEWFLLTSGLYNYYINAVKKNYPFLIPYLIFLPSGNSETGMQLLKKASESENGILQTEATYFLMKIYMEEEKNYVKAEKYSGMLTEKYPENLLYRYYHFKILLEQKNTTAASRELGLLKYHAEKNTELSAKQKQRFTDMAKNDLKKFYSRK